MEKEREGWSAAWMRKRGVVGEAGEGSMVKL